MRDGRMELLFRLINHLFLLKKCFKRPLTCDVGQLVLQDADVGHVDVEEGSELGHGHAHPGDGDVSQAAAAVHWREQTVLFGIKCLSCL